MSKETEQLSFMDENAQADNQPVVCLGMTFQSDEERKEYFQNELRKKLPELKQIEGFPIGEDEDIIALSDPPYYTACPNPWINDFIEEWEKEKVTKYERNPDEEYHREPFAADVSEGKNHPIYMAHAYHTKVPHRAIMKYLLHFTSPGDIVVDAFCGTGMTAVAAQMCSNKKEVSQLKTETTYENGERRVIISDLAPAATFISSNYNTVLDKSKFKQSMETIIDKLEEEYFDYFTTNHNDNDKGVINYIIWSEVYHCPYCLEEFDYWNTTYDKVADKTLKEFHCPSCNSILSKKLATKIWETIFDPISNENISVAKLIPVQINYTYKGKRYSKKPDKNDLQNIERSKEICSQLNIKVLEIPDGVNTSQPKISNGFKYIHQLYSYRTNLIINKFLSRIEKLKHYNLALFLLTASLQNMSFLYRWRASGKGGILTGTYYVCSTPQENNPFNQLRRKLNDICNVDFELNSAVISTNSATKQNIGNNSIDYVFTDPPFGANLMYSELNLLWENFLKVMTNNAPEAIMNSAQNKTMGDYHSLMIESFKEYYRILKPGRWITVEFSNSQASIWNSIQESIQKVGFVIANVAALDKKQGSFKAVTSTTAVKQDLVISAYKPTEESIIKMREKTNTPESAWIFVNQHLEKLPVFLGSKGEASIIAERTPRILFDRMVAYHVQNGLPVPISSAEFQAGVAQRFPMRDGMAFLENQVAEYDKKRILVKEFAQMSLFVSDETSAIEWIRQQLMKKTQTRQDLHPSFMKEIQHIAKHEMLPELDDLLYQNFLRYDGDGSVPDQIASYLRKNYKDLRGLDNDDSNLKEKALNRWYVPDPNKQADLEKLREKSLLREFEGYIEDLQNSKKKLKQFRTEAIRVGFKKAWSDKDYQKIVTVGDRLPESVIQEDDKLLMYYDNAQIRLGL